MRGRLLAALVFGLASMVAWAATIPFAPSAPVAVAYSETNPQIGSHTALGVPEQAVRSAASTTVKWSPAIRSWSAPAASDPANELVDPTPVFLATPAPQGDPTDAPALTSRPDPTNGPDATVVPDSTDAPDPTDNPDLSATPRPRVDPTATPDPTPRPTVRPTDAAEPTPPATPRPTGSPTPRPTVAPTPAPTSAPKTYTGSSHFWYPALNIEADWGWYGCDYGGPSTMPGGIWRWGCGPQSNVYLLSHAWSTFKKIRTAFHDGTMQVGQNVWYANAQGDVTKWEVQWIRHVTAEYLNSTASEWALDDSATPIMTLQTCDGSQSQLRIIVRLVPAT